MQTAGVTTPEPAPDTGKPGGSTPTGTESRRCRVSVLFADLSGSTAGYDQHHVSVAIELSPDVPPGIDVWTRRAYFDTRNFGKSAAGHLFPNALFVTEKRALHEYLKHL